MPVAPPTPPPQRTHRPLLVGGALVLLSAGIALALGLPRVDAPEATSVGGPSTAQVLGTQASEVVIPPAATTQRTVVQTPLRRAAASTTLHARGFALLSVPSGRLEQLAGARVQAKVIPVGAVVGDDIFWVGKGSDRLLVHLQGPGTRFSVRRGQRLTFAGVLTRTSARAPAAWGLSGAEGRRQLERQGHHIEVYGPRIRFVCAQHCFRFG